MNPTSTMAKSGINLRDLPQMMNPAFALSIKNYFITTDAGLSKRGGLERIFTIAGTVAGSMLEKFTDDIYIWGVGDTVGSYTKSTGVTAVIYTFPGVGAFSGQRYGEGKYFFVTNGTSTILRIDSTLVGTLVANSPIAKVLKVIDTRLFAGNLSTGGVYTADSSAVAYSTVDDGTDPPFTTWTIGTLATDGGLRSYRIAGDVTGIESLGQNVVVFGKEGKWAFYLTTIDSGGTLTKTENPVMSRQDMGGYGAKMTPKGLFYVNKGGLWQFISVGQPNIPFSDQEKLATPILGTDYFKNIDLSNAKIIYYARKNTVLISCAKNSTENNFIIAYNADLGSVCEFTNWTIGSWLADGQDIYAISSVNGKAWQCFKGSTDEGAPISTEYTQELPTGSLFTRKDLQNFYIQAFLSLSSSIKIYADIYTTKGIYTPAKLLYTLTADYNNNKSDGWGNAEWGKSAFGGDSDFANLIDCFAGGKRFIRNWQRLRIRIISGDVYPHTLNWFSAITKEKINIRRRNLTIS